MKITIKLKPDELRAVCTVLEASINNEIADTSHDAMITIMMLKMYKKFKEKSIMIEKPVRMGIPAEYALAFIDFFNHNLMPFSHETFEGNVLQKLLSKFNQKTAGLYQYY